MRGGVPGDVVTAHIIKAKKNYAVARLQQVLEPSPHRVESDCPVSAQCGGCAFRTVDYAEELRFKQQRIDDAFQRIGHLDLQGVAEGTHQFTAANCMGQVIITAVALVKQHQAAAVAEGEKQIEDLQAKVRSVGENLFKGGN